MNKPKILVIDDDSIVRRAFVLALEDAGYEVDTAETGEIGVGKIDKEKYSLVFLDLKMPGMSGIETLHRIRQDKVDLPIYIVTAFKKEYLDDLNKVKDQGIQFDILDKPLGKDQIVAVVEGVFEE